MDNGCNRLITLNPIKCTVRRTMFPHLKIKFNFYVRYEISDIVMYQDSTTAPEHVGDLAMNYNATDGVIVRGSLSYDDIREMVGKATAGHLLDDERRRVIRGACKKVRERLRGYETLPKYTILDLDLRVRIKYWRVHVVGSDYPRMVPAADSSLEMLEKCEADHCDRAEERCCCICLEELAGSGGVALRMPCSHVFHDGCIKEWLRTSHFCPLCRYEMPTE